MQANIVEGPNTSKYIPQIDSLRAIAVIAVIIYHVKSAILPGGFTGVDVFFVISGYVVSTSLARDSHKTFVSFLLGFYARRVLRIIPALLACLAITSIATAMFIPHSWLSSTSQDTGIYAYFGMSNFALVWSADGYFSPRTEFNPFAHTWSLAFEEQFYLLFPVIFFIWISLRDSRNLWLNLTGTWLLSATLILSIAYSWKTGTSNPNSAFYLLPSRLWELACGALLFQLQSRKKVTLSSKTGADWALSIGLIMILSGFFFSQTKPFHLPWGLLAVAGSMLSILGVSVHQSRDSLIARSLHNPALVFIGKLSYSLYLWHWPVFVLFRWTVGLESLPQITVALTLTTILAVSSFYFLENRVRESSLVQMQPKWKVIAAGAICVFVCWTFTSKLFADPYWISLSATKDKETWYPYPVRNSRRTQNRCNTEIHKIRINEAIIQTYQRAACDHAAPPPHSLYVIGDSHAGAYSAMLYQLTAEEGVRVVLYTRGGCSFASLQSSSAAQSTECAAFLATAMADIKKQARAGDIVLLAALRVNRLSDQWASLKESDVISKQKSDRSRLEREQALKEADTVIHTFNQQGVGVILDAPKPVFKSPAFRCSDWFNSKNPVCDAGLTIDREFLLSFRKPIMDSLTILSEKHPTLVVWDPFPILCPRNPCAAVDHRGPLFFDGDHLSGNGNFILYPSFLSVLREIWAASVRDPNRQMQAQDHS